MADFEYEIEAAKTEFRDAYSAADIPRLLNLLSDDFVDMSEGQASAFGSGARQTLQASLSQLFAAYEVKLEPVVIGVRGFGDWAFDYGWHKYTLSPKNGGTSVVKRQRYLEIWQKKAGTWKLAIFMDSKEAEVPVAPSLTSAT
jgi:ketosteroid isomerase-like protein